MSTALIKSDPNNSLALSDVMTLGDVFKASGYFKDVRDQAQAVVKILYGKELGFSPVVSMMGVYIVDGKPSMSANLLASAVKRSGKYDYRVLKNTNAECSIKFLTRSDEGRWEELGVTDFTMDDAKTARVTGKDVWAKYPKAMLFARAMAAGVRAHCPDVTTCPAYVPEELGVDVNEEGSAISVVPARSAEVRTFGKKPDIGGEGKSASEPVGEIKGASTDSLTPDLTAEMPMTEAELEIEYISIGQQKNFHIDCKAAVKPARSMDAENLTYQWLLDNGYYNVVTDKDGTRNEPTAAKIPASGWLAEKRKAIAWLKVQ